MFLRGLGLPEIIFIFFIFGFSALPIWFIVYMVVLTNKGSGKKMPDSSHISDDSEKRGAMNEEELRQRIRDEEHLKLLSIGYKVSAGINAFFSLFGFFYIFMGALFFTSIESEPGDPAPAIFAGIFIGIGLIIVVFGFGFAALKWHVGNLLKKRRSALFCQIIAGISCLGIPYGTLLGVFTFMVLARPTVIEMFKQGSKPVETN